MKNRNVRKVFVSSLLAMSLVFIFSSVSIAEKVTVRVAEHSPSVGIRAEGLNFFAKEVEEATKGRVKVQIYWSNSLLKEKEMILGAKNGSAGMVVSMSQKFKKELPHWFAFNTMMNGPDYRKQVDMFYKAIEEIPELVEDLDKQNLKIVGFHAIPFRVHYLTKPVSSIRDLKGKTIRVNSEAYGTLQKSVGALPVFMPASECFMAMERGTIDGVFTSFEAGYRFRFYEVAKTLLLNKEIWPGGVNIFSVNKDVFAKMSAEDQKAFMTAGKEMSYYFADLNDRDMGMMLSNIEKAGVKAIVTTNADITKWVNDPSVVAISAEWAEKTDNQELMKKVKALVAEFL